MSQTAPPWPPTRPARTNPVPAGLSYEQTYRAGRPGLGWPIGGILTALVLFVLSQVVVLIGFVIAFAVSDGSTFGDRIGDQITDLADLTAVTPAKFLFLNLSLVVTIPFVISCAYVFHRLSPKWVLSVAGRIRWRWLFASMGVALFTLVVAVVLGSLLPGGDDTTGTGDGSLNTFTSQTAQFLVMVILLTPLQSAAEEITFRGYLTQAFGSLFSNRRVSQTVAVLVPSLLFALAHSPQPATAFVDRFLFGVVSGILVIATGGLEAGIGYHVVNNVITFGLALGVGSMTETFNLTEGGWGDVVVSFVKSVLFVALTIALARRMGVVTRTVGTDDGAARTGLEPTAGPV